MKPISNPSVFGYTLGCRLNSYETEALVEELASALGGLRADTPDSAGVIIVNTCAVTGRSQARSRKAVRSYAARHPDALIVVTGCVAEVSPEDFREMESEGVVVVPNSLKGSIPEIISGKIGEPGGEGLFPCFAPVSTSRTRAFLKIQDGCSNRCTYCIVPHARGDSRSQPRETVLKQARDLANAGYKEICLTGVDIADYGTGLYDEGYRLPELVADLLDTGGFRLRIGSVEPLYLTVGALERMALPGLCRHFHIPFQSGSDPILRKMGRNYGREQEEELIAAIGELFPGACVGSDIIAGFPGETEEDFLASLSLASSPGINYLHVFPFSPRKGTPAWEMEQLHTETVTERAVELRRVSTGSRRAFRESMTGTVQTILVEGRKILGRNIGLTDNYIPVYAPEGSTEGELVQLELTRSDIVWTQR